jgi:hypothetical protein
MYVVKSGSTPISWRQSTKANGGEYEWKPEYGDITSSAIWDSGLNRHRNATDDEQKSYDAVKEQSEREHERRIAAVKYIIESSEGLAKTLDGFELDALFAAVRVLIRAQVELAKSVL